MSETLFLSTVTKEFGALRSRLARFLSRTKTVHVRHQDDFFPHGVKTLHVLEEEIVKSHFVVHVIGAEPGWSPPVDQAEAFLDRNNSFVERFPLVAEAARAGQLSATQWEAWLALFSASGSLGTSFPTDSLRDPRRRCALDVCTTPTSIPRRSGMRTPCTTISSVR